MDLKQFKTAFDQEFKIYIEQKISNAKKLVNHPQTNNFLDYISDYIFSGGKRIRPFVAFLTYQSFTKNQSPEKSNEMLKFSMIFETLHSMALIHDDIIDKSTKRHSVNTVHQHIEKTIHNERIANSQAILIGDIMLSRVYEFFLQDRNFDKDKVLLAQKNIHEMIEEVILGQMIDVDMMLGQPAELQIIETKNLYKTAKYTFSRPMTSGAILANANPEQIQSIEQLGITLGLAFQTRDDLLDLTDGDNSKSSFNDIQEGQQTVFTNYIFENGTDSEKTILKNSLGQKLSEPEIKELKAILENSGAINYGKSQIQKHLIQATQILEKLNFPNPENKIYFQQLIQKLGS